MSLYALIATEIYMDDETKNRNTENIKVTKNIFTIPELENNTSKKKRCPKILIVEDNSGVRFLLNEILKKHFQLEFAENGRMGLEIIQKYKIDLILSDIMMPEIDGIELCKKLKANHTTSHIPFVFLTARTSNESKIIAKEVGAYDYITKPFSKEILLNRIKDILNN